MNKERIKELALAAGFTLREQPDGSMGLNRYVYKFADALLAETVGDPEWASLVCTRPTQDATPENAPYMLRTRRYRGVQWETVMVPCHVLRVVSKESIRVLYWEQYGNHLIPGTPADVGPKTRYVKASRIAKKESHHG